MKLETLVDEISNGRQIQALPYDQIYFKLRYNKLNLSYQYRISVVIIGMVFLLLIVKKRRN